MVPILRAQRANLESINHRALNALLALLGSSLVTQPQAAQLAPRGNTRRQRDRGNAPTVTPESFLISLAKQANAWRNATLGFTLLAGPSLAPLAQSQHTSPKVEQASATSAVTQRALQPQNASTAITTSIDGPLLHSSHLGLLALQLSSAVSA